MPSPTAPFLPALRLTGAQVLRDGALRPDSIGLAEERLSDAPLPSVDLSGYLVLPGIIDLHGDAFERQVAPRPSAPFPLEMALRATDAEAAANGVTTAWLAQSWSWEGGARGPDFAERMMEALSAYRPHARTDLRLQIRCETHTVGTEARLLAALGRHGIDYVIFNNHLEEAAQVAASRPDLLLGWAQKAGRTPQDHLRLIREARTQSREVPRYLCRLAGHFDSLGITYGSHDDPDGETRETFSMIGAKICEFPTARPAAALAHAVGDPILMGAPNVVRGGSQSGNIAAAELIRAGLCDALVSDYHYPALAAAAFRLADDGLLPLARAWEMISTRPAQILSLTDRGHIAPGLRADLVILDAATRRIEATISAGRIAHMTGPVAARFLAATPEVRLAAE
ncbi:alpha-D-ribose 1-methylphosphonate 5-triphosphate diphosphatase [Pseudooceanicola sp. CBS1P-1]|uniref:Alpha-D-ribose 1-methylphosphonate 5-triphosphate diphosphatase n=1 Tax=Pseudooceanicola albus TaxID=2692189 RepID=A0A6L7G0D4_9RHOB|nr:MULTISPECIES: alpha-D-ribose 1-methylphosphonate 5-triphosphate diphosphatase [Pseudooceanicola]MBT9382354.1 alpha-D-ribose 1-methylphosphonate 5-triphosphate diphosphatase [Pseudooceanicola endophyticus]MXN16896.1 alpha-D-ribose 1-methylphosphonate 5-triphosphate diphosphatase [Pseudooceanicola albus]